MTNEDYIALNLELAKALKFPAEFNMINSINFLNDKAFMLDLISAHEIDIEFNYDPMIDPLTKKPYGQILVSAWIDDNDYTDFTEFYISHNNDKSLALRVAIARAVIGKLKGEK